MIPGEDTPIYNELVKERVDEHVRHPDEPPAFRHAGGISCHGCQMCLTEAYDSDDDQWSGWFPGGVKQDGQSSATG
jgi:hypothetical protein